LTVFTGVTDTVKCHFILGVVNSVRASTT